VPLVAASIETIKYGRRVAHFRFREGVELDRRLPHQLKVEIQVGRQKHRSILPRSEYLDDSNGGYLFLVKGSSAIRHKAILKPLDASRVEVVSGARPGDRVVISDYRSFLKARRLDFKYR
jgi:HlyD family secretion protein